ncbi:uncharacterized protein LOC131876601 [Cryptomeria japonica]|uniref:uncharacterized protein LOC131876601 n=1 Tax=Cryptomeria japonica TaxID=3369 RepID=UPI0027DA8A8F|nr:uncharacterized protein LOC131876601 [Cryptomeria japonica]
MEPTEEGLVEVANEEACEVEPEQLVVEAPISELVLAKCGRGGPSSTLGRAEERRAERSERAERGVLLMPAGVGGRSAGYRGLQTVPPAVCGFRRLQTASPTVCSSRRLRASPPTDCGFRNLWTVPPTAVGTRKPPHTLYLRVAQVLQALPVPAGPVAAAVLPPVGRSKRHAVAADRRDRRSRRLSSPATAALSPPTTAAPSHRPHWFPARRAHLPSTAADQKPLATAQTPPAADGTSQPPPPTTVQSPPATATQTPSQQSGPHHMALK